MNNANIQKVEKFFSTKFVNQLTDILIFQNEDGVYELFNKYQIKKEDDFFKVTMNLSSNEKKFTFLKNAVAWCIFDSKNKFFQATRIEYLDRMISGADLNIANSKRLISKTDEMESKLIYVSKLTQELVKKKQMVEEIKDFLQQSRRLQTKKFAPK